MSTRNRPVLAIDIWSDVMCPWCIIGYKHLETALAGLAGEIDSQVRWRPFELNPNMATEGEDSAAHLARKYGRTAQQSADARMRMSEMAEAAGYSFRFTGPLADDREPPAARLWNTFLAHKLLAHTLRAHGSDAQTRLKLALFDAHFQQRRDVSDRAVLAEIYVAVGLPEYEAMIAFDDPVLGDLVRAEEAQAMDLNITGVPAVVVGGRFLIPGAQDPATYAAALRRAVERGMAA